MRDFLQDFRKICVIKIIYSWHPYAVFLLYVTHTVESGMGQKLMLFDFADWLGHGSHRAEGTPAPGFEKNHNYDSDKCRGEHEAVETETELGYPVRDHSLSVGPSPRYPESPEKLDHLPKAFSSGCHQPCLDYDIAEHA